VFRELITKVHNAIVSLRVRLDPTWWFPRWDRNLNTGDGTRSQIAQQEIAHDATRLSRIVLPVIPASEGQA
jgi:hypothetical protein